MKLTTKRLKQIIKEVLSEYGGDDVMHDMQYGTDSRVAPAMSAQPTPEEIEAIQAKMDKLMQAAMDGDQGAIQMLMDYE
jgi:uncharacterized protein YaaR (DUF327 family)